MEFTPKTNRGKRKIAVGEMKREPTRVESRQYQGAGSRIAVEKQENGPQWKRESWDRSQEKGRFRCLTSLQSKKQH